jgi:hypothetical protein
MVRHSDHATSIAAAATVRRVTLRQCVLDIAERAGRVGVTDDELKIAHPDTPESSVRKRRTELAQENVLLDTGRTRLNRHGQAEAVWVLRDFHPCPPPVLNRTQAMSKDNQIATLQARVRGLECAMRQAIHEAEGSGGASFAAIKMTDILTAAL